MLARENYFWAIYQYRQLYQCGKNGFDEERGGGGEEGKGKLFRTILGRCTARRLGLPPREVAVMVILDVFLLPSPRHECIRERRNSSGRNIEKIVIDFAERQARSREKKF